MNIELLKSILTSKEPSALIKQNEEYVFSLIPELRICKGFQQNNPWHIYDVYDHILKVLDAVPKCLKIRMAALFHDVGKPYVYHADENGIGHFYGHWIKSVEIFESFAKSAGLDSEFSASVAKLIFYHDINFGKLSDKELEKIIEKFNAEELAALFDIKRADLLAQNPKYNWMIKNYEIQEEMMLKRKNINLCTITPNDGYNYFFGYYDLQPYSKDGEKHLAHRVKFNDRLPNPNDAAEIGYINLGDNTFVKISETHAWNFQQGAMLCWFDEENIIYNDFKDGKYCAVIKNINTGSEKTVCMPIANLSSDRKYGLSINFNRVYDFRPGYGYCNLKDEFFDVKIPECDGIYLVDIEKNTADLIINYKQLAESFPEKPFTDMKLVVNHITFNPSASRFLFLLRNFADGRQNAWGTMLLTADRYGKNIKNLTNYEFNSHYYWKNDDEIIIYSGLPKNGIYHINDKTGEREYLNDGMINAGDIHCIYSPDSTCFIGDGYPDKEQYRHLYLYDMISKKSVEILKSYSMPPKHPDIRCDLHNRFNHGGTKVSFDSFHTEYRSICEFEFDKDKLLK